jgi:hypothetical protein
VVAESLLERVGAIAVDRDDRLRLEATLSEIDSGFAEADLPPTLSEVRARLVAAVVQV